MPNNISLREALEQTADAKEMFSATGHRGKIAHLLRFFADAGLPLATAADAQHLNRYCHTLKKYCRDYQISFPDYVPMSMRPQKGEQAQA